jgi:glutaredoxin
MIIIYTLPICPNCDKLKRTLEKNDIKFISKNLEDDNVRMELLLDSVTLVEAPIVKINGVYMNSKDAIKLLNIPVE